MISDDVIVMRARTGDPSTSQEAMAAFSKRKMAKAVDHVVELFRQFGPMADFQLRQRFLETWGKKCSYHLHRQARSFARDEGRIRDSGRVLIDPATNRKQVVWEPCNESPMQIVTCPTCGHVTGRVRPQ